MALQLRRGTNAQRLAITPLDGELIVVTDYDDVNVSALWLGDGETPGGINPIALELDELLDVTITDPAEGQMLFYDGAEWRNSSVITSTTPTNRTTFRYDTSSAGIQTALNLRKNREGSAFANGDGAALKFQVSSNGTGTTEFATISGSYSSTQPSIAVATSVNNGSSYQTHLTIGNFGVDIYDSELSLNRGQVGTPTLNAVINANRGDQPSAVIRWNEATDRWQVSNDGTNYYNLPSQSLDTTSEPTFAGVTAGVVRIGTPGIDNLIDTSASDLALRAATNLIRIEGDLVVAYNVLTVKDDTNRVGVNNISPSYDLDVTGQTRSSLGGIFRNIDVGLGNANSVSTTTGNLTLNSNTGEVVVANNLTINGNLTVSGTTTTIDVSDLQVEDNIILLNRNEASAGISLGTAGIEIERGSLANVQWVFDEANDWWSPAGDGNSLNIWAAGNILAGQQLSTNGNEIVFNNDDGAAANCDLTVKRGAFADVRIRWNEDTDRWTFTNDGSTYYNLPNQNLDTNTLVQFSGVNLDDRAVIDTVNATTTSTTEFTLDGTARNAIKLMVYMQRGTDSHCVEILIMRTSTSAMMTTYGEMYTSTPLATFTADQSAGSIRVRATPTSATSTTFSAQRCSLT